METTQCKILKPYAYFNNMSHFLCIFIANIYCYLNTNFLITSQQTLHSSVKNLMCVSRSMQLYWAKVNKKSNLGFYTIRYALLVQCRAKTHTTHILSQNFGRKYRKNISHCILGLEFIEYYSQYAILRITEIQFCLYMQLECIRSKLKNRIFCYIHTHITM